MGGRRFVKQYMYKVAFDVVRSIGPSIPNNYILVRKDQTLHTAVLDKFERRATSRVALITLFWSFLNDIS